MKINDSLIKIIRDYDVERAIVFGSQARGAGDETSDIDLVMVKETKLQFLERLKEFALLLPPGLPRVDAFIYTPKEFEVMQEWGNPLIETALREGKVIYEAS